MSSDCKANLDKTSINSVCLPVNKSTEVAKYLPFRESHVGHHPLSNYILNHPDHLANVDMSYLAMKLALTIPGISLRNEILKAYAQFVHPFCRFWICYNSSIPSSRATESLALVQAVLATGVAFADVEHLQLAGYPTNEKARMGVFRRVRLLYDFDFDTERVTPIQSLLSMTYWHTPPNISKDALYWLGVGFALARRIGSHGYPKTSRMDVHQQRLWKRI